MDKYINKLGMFSCIRDMINLKKKLEWLSILNIMDFFVEIYVWGWCMEYVF